MSEQVDRIKGTLGSIIWGTHSKYGHLFDYVMIALILLSMLTLTVQTIPGLQGSTYDSLYWIELFIILVFTVEYGFRLWTTEHKLKYIFSFWGIVDIIAILPFWLLMFGFIGGAGGSQASRTLRLMRLMRLLKLARYLAAIERIGRTFEIIWRELVVFGFLAVVMIFVAAVGIYHFEHQAQPEIFTSIPAAMWFAVVTLTTVGYGDVTPITDGGRIFTGLILFIGLGIVAVPTGLISSGLTQARQEEQSEAAEHERS